MVPRRNPEFAVVVLQEHGDWGAGSAKLAAQIVTAYVNKKRKQENNLLQADKPPASVEMGAIWSTPEGSPKENAEARRSHSEKPEASAQAGMTQVTGMQGGRFLIATNQTQQQPGKPDHQGQSERLDYPIFPTRNPKSDDLGAGGAWVPVRVNEVVY
jgi:hypothetical protein